MRDTAERSRGISSTWRGRCVVEDRGSWRLCAGEVGLRYAIYRGITTGLNDAFIVDNQTKEALVAADPKSAEILKPVLRGRDIRRYRARWANLWLIDSHNGYGTTPAINIDDFPAVKAHLDAYSPRLAKRHDKGTTPYNLRNCAYHAEFSKEKLFWADMANAGRFAFSDEVDLLQ